MKMVMTPNRKRTWDFLNDKEKDTGMHCEYTLRRGKNVGKRCGKTTKCQTDKYCSSHAHKVLELEVLPCEILDIIVDGIVASSTTLPL